MIKMNLYRVCDKHYEWGCFVFAKSRNQAKYIVANYFSEEYTAMRARILKRGVNIDHSLIVDCEDSKGYDLVQECGFRYPTQEEIDNYYG